MKNMNNDSIDLRQQAIYEFVSERNFTAIKELCEALDLKPATVRRDIKRLEQQNKLISFHGGVSVVTGYEKYELRTLRNAEIKKEIGKRAATLVESNDTLYIGGGSTTYAFARELVMRSDIKNVLVIASSINTASLFVDRENFKVMIPGGEIYALDESQTSPVALDLIRSFYFSKAFVGTSAIDPAVGYTNPKFDLNELKKVVLEHSKEVILLCDHTKIGKADPFVACPTRGIDIMITDCNRETKALTESIAAKGTDVIEV